MDLAKPKPFSLSCKSVTPCADRAGADVDKPLRGAETAALASLRETQRAICLGTVAARGVQGNIVINVVDDGVGQVKVVPKSLISPKKTNYELPLK